MLENVRRILDCGGKRSATPLWGRRTSFRSRLGVRKRRRRSALPAQSKTVPASSAGSLGTSADIRYYLIDLILCVRKIQSPTQAGSMKTHSTNYFSLALALGALGMGWSPTSIAQTFTTIKSFGILTNVTGFGPRSQLVQGPDGTLYGTTVDGDGDALGTNGHVRGTIFKVQPDGSGFVVLKWLTNSVEGANPYAGVTLSGNTLYGTTANGGSSDYGTVFKVNTDGTGYTVLKHFALSDGATPQAGLTLSGSALYGTTYSGGSSGWGTVFKVNTDGTGYTVLQNFSYSDGGYPNAGLTLSGSTLYGTTETGGNSGSGTIFKLNTDGTSFIVVKSFASSNGATPEAGVILSGSTLYGTRSRKSFSVNLFRI